MMAHDLYLLLRRIQESPNPITTTTGPKRRSTDKPFWVGIAVGETGPARRNLSPYAG